MLARGLRLPFRRPIAERYYDAASINTPPHHVIFRPFTRGSEAKHDILHHELFYFSGTRAVHYPFSSPASALVA